jgi:flagellar motor switch protein FliM
MRTLLRGAPVVVDARLRGGGLRVDKLLDLAVGDVISLEIPAGRPADVQINGKLKFQGEIVAAGTRRGVVIAQPKPVEPGEKN